MRKWCYHWLWHIPLGGLCFLLFFSMGLTYLTVVTPLLYVFFRNKRKRTLFARTLVSRSFSFFVWILGLEHVDVDIIHPERLNRPGLLIAPSHPTLIDVVLLISKISNANCIVKSELTHSIFMRGPIFAAGYISNDNGPEIVKECARSLFEGDSLIIFPEGTRTKPGVSPHFQRGIAAVALEANKAITPVKIVCTPPALMKGLPWYRLPQCRMRFSIIIEEDIAIEPYQTMVQDRGHPIAVRQLTNTLKTVLFPCEEGQK